MTHFTAQIYKSYKQFTQQNHLTLLADTSLLLPAHPDVVLGEVVHAQQDRGQQQQGGQRENGPEERDVAALEAGAQVHGEGALEHGAHRQQRHHHLQGDALREQVVLLRVQAEG